LQKIDPKARVSSQDMRLMTIGGVKASGRTDHLSPAKTERLREMRPDLEIFGMNDPTFMGGCLAAGLFTSISPISTDRIDPDSTIPMIRRSLLNDSILQGIELSDEGSMQELSELNHTRSVLEATIKRLTRLEKKDRTGKEQRDVETSLETLSKLTGTPITNSDDAEIALTALKEQMKQSGYSDVSEANIQTVATIPAATPMRHLMYLNYISPLGAGLFMWGMHDAWCFDPAIGGMAARGAGGYLSCVYNVERQVGYTWEPDCKITLKPDTGVQFISNTESRLQSAFEAWREVDITRYDWSFKALKDFVGEK
jgi:hypothetical protein